MAKKKKVSDTARRTSPTTAIKGGVQYAKVADRLLALHEDSAKCTITTDVRIEVGKSSWVFVKAQVANERGDFTAHAAGLFSGKDKFVEKLETVAVGRALAFAGYMASGEIASFEEMSEFERSSLAPGHDADPTASRVYARLQNAKQPGDFDLIEAKVKQLERDGNLDSNQAYVLQARISDHRASVLGIASTK